MVILGLVLIAAAVVFGVEMVTQNKFRIPDPKIFGHTLGITSGRAFFVIGVLVGGAIAIGIGLLALGITHRRAVAVSRRRDRELVRSTTEERDSLRSQNEGLRQGFASQPEGAAHVAPVADESRVERRSQPITEEGPIDGATAPQSTSPMVGGDERLTGDDDGAVAGGGAAPGRTAGPTVGGTPETPV